MPLPFPARNTSSSVGLCKPTDSIAPGNASTTSAMKRCPSAISTRSVPSTLAGLTPKRAAILPLKPLRSCVFRITTSPPIFALSSAGVPSDDLAAFVQQHKPVAAVSFIENVARQQHRDAFIRPQFQDILPQLAARSRVEAGGRFVHQQNRRPVQQSLGDLDAPFQAAGEGFDHLAQPIAQPKPSRDFVDALAQHSAGKPCRWPWPRRFSSTVSFLSRLCDWNTTPIFRRTASGSRLTSCPQIDARPSLGAINVERMRNRVDLPPPFGPSSPKISPSGTLETNAGQRHALAISMGQIFDRNDHRRRPVKQHQAVNQGKVDNGNHQHRAGAQDRPIESHAHAGVEIPEAQRQRSK